jgi:predicted MFS family arabinose efflux permease
MPVGMQPLGILLLAREATGSYGRASLVVAGAAVGQATISPLRGRAVDRRGAARVLPGFAVAFAIAVGALIAAAELGAPTVVLAALAVACGGSVPPVGATMRTLLAERLGTDAMQTAMSVQTLAGEASFLLGPAIVGLCVALASPELALALMAVFVIVGTLGFATSSAARGHAGLPPAGGRLAVLRSPGMRTLMVVTVLWGATFGALDVALPAFADERGSAAAGGALLTALSIGVAVGTLAYGTRTSDRPLERRYVLAAAIAAASFALLPLAMVTWELGAILFLVGMALAPPTVCLWLVLGSVAPPQARTEATTWVSSGVAVGAAVGAVSAGPIVDAAGARTALLAAFVSSSLAALTSLVRQHSLRPGAAA